MTQEAYDAAIKGKEDPNKAREYNVDVEMKWQYYLRRIFEKRRNIYYGEFKILSNMHTHVLPLKNTYDIYE